MAARKRKTKSKEAPARKPVKKGNTCNTALILIIIVLLIFNIICWLWR